MGDGEKDAGRRTPCEACHAVHGSVTLEILCLQRALRVERAQLRRCRAERDEVVRAVHRLADMWPT